MFSLEAIRHPGLEPLLYVKDKKLRPERLSPEQDFLFDVKEEDNFITFTAHPTIFPGGGWTFDVSGEARAIHDISYGSGVSVTPLDFTSTNRRRWRRKDATHIYDLELSVSPHLPLAHAHMKVVWSYEYVERVNPQKHPDEYRLYLWSKYAKAITQLAQESQPHVLAELGKIAPRRYEKLREYVPSLPEYQGEHQAFFRKISEEFARLLPEKVRPLVFAPHAAIKSFLLRERIELTCHFQGTEAKSVDLKMLSSSGPKERPKRGFSLIEELAGFIPTELRENTHGEKIYIPLEPDQVRVVVNKESQRKVLEAGSCLRLYALMFRELEAPLVELASFFRASELSTTGFVVRE